MIRQGSVMARPAMVSHARELEQQDARGALFFTFLQATDLPDVQHRRLFFPPFDHDNCFKLGHGIGCHRFT